MKYQRKEIIGDYSWDNIPISGFPKRVVVYAIRGKETVYVGSTSQVIKNRISAHISDARKGSDLPIHIWMIERKFIFSVYFLEECDLKDREKTEKKWVSFFGDKLLNITDGGKGMSGNNFAGTTHAKRIGDAIRTGEYHDCLNCGKSFFRKLSEVLKGNCKFCSRDCYHQWQTGRTKKQRCLK